LSVMTTVMFWAAFRIKCPVRAWSSRMGIWIVVTREV
jgi:hypothetical protein